MVGSRAASARVLIRMRFKFIRGSPRSGRRRLLAGSSQQRSGRIDAVDACHLPAIERQIQARLDADLQHTTAGLRHYPPPVFDEPLVGHREVGEAWQDMIAVTGTGASPIRR